MHVRRRESGRDAGGGSRYDGAVAKQGATRWSDAAFAVAFVLTLWLFYRVVAPFVTPVLIGLFIVVLFGEANERLVRKLGFRRRLAAGVSTTVVLLAVLVPSAVIGYVLVVEGAQLLQRIGEFLGPGGLEGLFRGRVPARLEPLVDRLGALGLGARIAQAASAGATWLTAQVGQVVGATAAWAIDAFLTVVTIFYLFVDGPRLTVQAMRLSPLENRYEREFLREFRNVSYAMVYVNVVTALVQGLLGAVGFLIVGLPQPLVWAGMMAFFSFVPLLGTGLVWVPAAAILALTGRPVAGLFLAGWGLLVIGSVDNVIRPLLAKGRMQLHPLLVFLTLFGGLAAFGPIGVLLGPLVGSIFTAMIRIWQRDFVPRLAAEHRESVQDQKPSV